MDDKVDTIRLIGSSYRRRRSMSITRMLLLVSISSICQSLTHYLIQDEDSVGSRRYGDGCKWRHKVHPALYSGSANKLGIGIVKEDGTLLSNIRHTYITPPGSVCVMVEVIVYEQGFLPRETADHHRDHIFELIKSAFKEANITSRDITCICFTKGMY